MYLWLGQYNKFFSFYSSTVDSVVLTQNVKLIAEAIVHHVYNLSSLVSEGGFHEVHLSCVWDLLDMVTIIRWSY